MVKKIVLCSFIIAFSLSLFSFSALAEEVDISAEELEVEEPGILSWFKNAFDTIQLWITQDLVKKSELELRKASRQLIKAREIVQNNADDENLQNRFSKIDDKYKDFINGINNRIQQFQEENPDSDKFKNFLDKYTNHQILHQEILQKLEEQVPEAVMEKIQEKRQEHLENFGEVMNKLQEKEEFKERLNNILNDEQQRIENRIKAMNTIEELEECAGEGIREAIQELKQEKKEIFQELNNKKQEIRGNSQEDNATQQQINTNNQGEDSQLQQSVQQNNQKGNN